MKRTTIMADEEVLRRLAGIARRRKVGTSAVIREALADYVAKAEPHEVPRRFSFIGIASSGHTDTAERAEEILDELADEDYRDAMGLHD